ncbi:MAG: hypothetical protein JST54_35445 [Deltaproteobacteria bacterium]|nr:hypothetical protein [Deltaproteobacteria bacterium]
MSSTKKFTFDARVLFDSTRQVLSGFAEGRGPDPTTERLCGVQQTALWDLLIDRETSEARRLAERISDLREGIEAIRAGQRPDPELAAKVEARLGTASELRRQIAERLRGLRPELASCEGVFDLIQAADALGRHGLTVNLRWQLEFADDLVAHIADELSVLRVAELGLAKASQELLALMERAVELLGDET